MFKFVGYTLLGWLALLAVVVIMFINGHMEFVGGFIFGSIFMLVPQIVLFALTGRWAWRKYRKVQALDREILPFVVFVELHEFAEFHNDNWVMDLGAHWVEVWLVNNVGAKMWPKIHAGLKVPDKYGPWREDFITAAQELSSHPDFAGKFPLDGVPEVMAQGPPPSPPTINLPPAGAPPAGGP
jgi:hypothetical protein